MASSWIKWYFFPHFHDRFLEECFYILLWLPGNISFPHSLPLCVFLWGILKVHLLMWKQLKVSSSDSLSTLSWSLHSRGRNNNFFLWYSFRNRQLYWPRTPQHEFLIIFHKFTIISCVLYSKYNFYTPYLLYVPPEFDVTESKLHVQRRDGKVQKDHKINPCGVHFQVSALSRIIFFIIIGYSLPSLKPPSNKTRQ